MSVIQLRKSRNFAAQPERQWDEARLRARVTVVTRASEALVEALEANLVAANLIRHLSEQPTPARLHLIDVINVQLQMTLVELQSLLEGLKSL